MSRAKKAFLWIAPAACFLAILLWVGLAPLSTGAGPALPRLDPAAFVRTMRARDFREAQLRYFARLKFDWRAFGYPSGLPYEPYRGPMPEPDEPPAPASFLADAAYQAELDELTRSELTRNRELRLYQNGDALAPMLALVGGAKRYLFVQMLSIACDPRTEGLIQAIEGRARTGTDVRILVNQRYALLGRSCLQRLEAAGAAVLRAPIHASYVLNDEGELLIGSESVARMFFASDGYNGLDRDLMLLAKGAVATDALRDFISTWEAARSEKDRDDHAYLKLLADKTAAETAEGSRGPARYAGWLKEDARGLCRLTARPELLLSLARRARRRIVFSGVKLGRLPAVDVALERARNDGVEVDFMGNGREGGNGELTMWLDELIRERQAAGWPRVARAMELVRDADVRGQARARFDSYARLAAAGPLTIWGYSGFLHYKLWVFDDAGAWIGSANPDEASFAGGHEAGIFCMDSRLLTELTRQLRLDRMNSVPFPARTMTR